MVTDKLTVTHQLQEALSTISGKALFMPTADIGLALQYLEEHGIPNNKVEDYKYCNVEAILRREFKSFAGHELAVDVKTLRNNYYVEGACNVYVVNGRLEASISDDLPGLRICPIENAPSPYLQKYLGAQCKPDAGPFAALNTAYADRGLFLCVEAGTVTKKNIVIHHIFSTSQTYFFNVRNLFVVEENAQVKITEAFYKAGGRIFYNPLTEVFTGKHAQVDHCRIQNAGKEFFGVDTLQAAQSGYSRYTHASYIFSGALVRNNLNAALKEEFAECHLYGLTLSKNTQVVDNHTLVDHLVPNCQSNELYKGIALDKSMLTFNGQIFVEKDAQKTNAYQSSKNILLSDDATVNAKPELEIYANDVKCSHGTSTGKVDETALFYLKTRGIGEEQARKLLLHAFAHEVINKVADADTGDYVVALFEENLN